jgi:hypothetical protein
MSLSVISVSRAINLLREAELLSESKRWAIREVANPLTAKLLSQVTATLLPKRGTSNANQPGPLLRDVGWPGGPSR